MNTITATPATASRAGAHDLVSYAALLLRVTLGATLLTHGLIKLFVFTLPGTAAFFSSVGFPGWTAYIVAPAEALGGLALIVGFQTRWVAIATLPILLGAMSVHIHNGYTFSNANGGWEYPLFLVAAAVLAALLGGGRYALTRSA
ncbi:DoxX family protein [Solimonas marina]|uniref:DoxX family protein n=1 Tax=Solimonas marina TaxID=2714601 RepID=A0A970B365_9GAMM|nr:DoxX family protein [Solimonas marina]NKF20902.1 DoxX family protein [Solimonas marina]